MAIVINGSGTVTGLSVGGLPDGSVDSDTLASGIDKTSISDSGDATAIKIDSSERVAIGNTDAGNYYSSANNLVVYDATDHVGMTIASGGSDKINSIYFADGTSGTAEYEGSIEYHHSTNTMLIGTNHATVLSIDSTGAVTMPKQPAFLVTKTSTSSNSAINTDHTVIFNNEVYDQNGDISSNTFTAPVTGKYLLTASLRLDNVDEAANYYLLGIIGSNRSFREIWNPGGITDNDSYHNMQVSGLLDMDANDTAIVRFNQSAGNAQVSQDGNAEMTYFCGYLVC